jgi:hypothetical protein
MSRTYPVIHPNDGIESRGWVPGQKRIPRQITHSPCHPRAQRRRRYRICKSTRWLPRRVQVRRRSRSCNPGRRVALPPAAPVRNRPATEAWLCGSQLRSRSHQVVTITTDFNQNSTLSSRPHNLTRALCFRKQFLHCIWRHRLCRRYRLVSFGLWFVGEFDSENMPVWPHNAAV